MRKGSVPHLMPGLAKYRGTCITCTCTCICMHACTVTSSVHVFAPCAVKQFSLGKSLSIVTGEFTHTHTRTHVQTHAHTHTHTHTHTRLQTWGRCTQVLLLLGSRCSSAGLLWCRLREPSSLTSRPSTLPTCRMSTGKGIHIVHPGVCSIMYLNFIAMTVKD